MLSPALSGTPSTRKVLALLLALALFMTACGSKKSNSPQGASASASNDTTKPVYGGSVTYAQDAEDAGGLCLPEAQLDAAGINYARTIYDTLTVPNADGKFVPFLAQSVTKNADATVWSIALRQAVKFHDGTPLTATVVKNNLDAYRGTYPARHPVLFGLVFGPYVKDVAADDATNTVTVTVDGDPNTPGNQGWQAFDSYLWSSGRLGIMAQAQLDDATNCSKNLIGTGPYKLKDWVVNDHFTAVKNPDYWGTDPDNGNAKLPYLDELTFKPIPDGQQRLNGLVSGQFQMIYSASPIDQEQYRALAQQGTINETEASKYTTTAHLMLCSAAATDTVCPGSPFSNAHARNAVAYALDRQSLNHVRGKDIAQIANGPFPPGSVGYVQDTGFPTFDLQKAKDEVAAYKTDTGKDLEFTYGTIATPEATETQNFIKDMLQAAGMKISTYTVEQTQYINVAVQRNFQMYDWNNFGGSDPDGLFVWWHCNNQPPAACDNLVNFGAFNDPVINSDLQQGRSESDPAKRSAFYEDLNREFSKQLFDIWETWTVWAVASSPKVHGIFGPTLPDGSKPDPNMATGFPVSRIYVIP